MLFGTAVAGDDTIIGAALQITRGTEQITDPMVEQLSVVCGGFSARVLAPPLLTFYWFFTTPLPRKSNWVNLMGGGLKFSKAFKMVHLQREDLPAPTADSLEPSGNGAINLDSVDVQKVLCDLARQGDITPIPQLRLTAESESIEGWTAVLNSLLLDSSLPDGAFRYYLLLCYRARQTGQAFSSQHNDAAMIGVNSRTIRRYRTVLDDRRLITVTHRKGMSDLVRPLKMAIEPRSNRSYEPEKGGQNRPPRRTKKSRT